MDLISELKTVVQKLNEAEIPYALCGGLAVAFHGYVRATLDIDLLIRPEHLNRVSNAVGEIGYVIEGGAIPLGVSDAHPREVHRISKVVDRELVTLDLVVVTPTLESAWNSRQHVDWNDGNLCVVSRDGLGIMKRLSRRPNDLVDLHMLGIPTDDD